MSHPPILFRFSRYVLALSTNALEAHATTQTRIALNWIAVCLEGDEVDEQFSSLKAAYASSSEDTFARIEGEQDTAKTGGLGLKMCMSSGAKSPKRRK